MIEHTIIYPLISSANSAANQLSIYIYTGLGLDSIVSKIK